MFFSYHEVLGIDIGRRFIKAVVMRKGKGGIEILNASLVKIESFPQQNEQERIGKVMEALGKTLEIVGKKSRRVALACPGKDVFFRPVKLPPVAKGKLKQIVHYEAQQQIPFSLEEAIWDYHLLSHREKTEMRALILAVRKDIVQDIMAPVVPLKVDVELLDYTPFSIYNTLCFTGEISGNKSFVILDMGAQSTNIIIVEGGEIAMVRSLPLGGDNFTQAIARSFDIDFFDAEKLKQEVAFVPTAEREISSEKERKLFVALQPLLDELLDEIRRSIGYYRSQLRGSNIAGLIFTGGGIQLKNIDSFIEQNLRIKATKVNPFTKLSGPSEILSRFSEPSTFSVALGLGLRLLGEGKIKINLLPQSILQRAEFRKKEPVLIASFALVLLIMLVYSGIIRQKASREKIVLKGLSDAIVKYTALEKDLKPKRKEKQKSLKLISQFEEISRERTFWLDIFNEIAYLIPDGIILERFSPFQPSRGPRDPLRGEAIAVAQGIRLQGLSPNYDMISELMLRLEASPMFKKIDPDPSTGQVINLDEKKFIKFILIADINREAF